MDSAGPSDEPGETAESDGGQAADAAADGTTVFSGDAAAAAAKPYRKWFWAAIGVFVPALAVGIATGRSAEQLTFLLTGLGALYGAAFVWRTGLGSFNYTSYGGERRLELRQISWPKGLVLGGLTLFGVLVLLATLPGRLGASVAAPVRTGFVLWDFGKVAAEWLILIALVGFCIVGLRKKEDRGPAGCLLGLLAVVYGAMFLLYRLAPGYFAPVWDEGTRPLRDMWNMLHG